MAVHVAILLPRYIRLILEGVKTVESRFTVTSRAPYRRIAPGERIYFKASAGPYMAAATADSVQFLDALTPRRMQKLRTQHGAAICGDDEYWQAKSSSRYGTLITLRDVVASNEGPAMPPSQGLAWFVLDESHVATGAGNMIDLRVTAGAVKNSYLRAAGELGGRFQLLMPDGRAVDTHVTQRGLIHWRGWGTYFQRHGVKAGDAVRLVPETESRFQVTFVNQRAASR